MYEAGYRPNGAMVFDIKTVLIQRIPVTGSVRKQREHRVIVYLGKLGLLAAVL